MLMREMMKKVLFFFFFFILLGSVLFFAECMMALCCRLRGLEREVPKLGKTRVEFLKNQPVGVKLADKERAWEDRYEIHPFFGYVYNSAYELHNNFGFPTKHDFVLRNGHYALDLPGKSHPLVIGIFGGSFAEKLGWRGKYLEEKLAGVFPGRDPVVLNFGIGGHGLPQAAFIFIYFRELVDVAVFVDGLNEIWNPLDNNRAGFPPQYSKAIHYQYRLSLRELSAEKVKISSRILARQRLITRFTRVSLWPVFRRLLLTHYSWVLAVGGLERATYQDYLTIKKGYERAGRFFDASDPEILDFSLRQWKEYHSLLHTIALSQEVLDIHLLQPNPSVPGSKVLTAEEKSLIAHSLPVKEFVLAGYPGLKEKMAELPKAGLIAEDQTDIFKDESQSLWEDSSHPNERGCFIILDRIAQLILQHYQK